MQSLPARWQQANRRQCFESIFEANCKTVFRPEMRENKKMEHFRDSEKNGNPLKPKINLSPSLTVPH